jgi:transposase
MGNPKGIKRNFKELETRRLKAGRLIKEGLKNADIARQLKVSRQSVGRWRDEQSKGGADKLRSAGRAGRKSKLTSTQEDKIISALQKGAKSHGYSSEMWTLPRVAKLIMEVTGVRYHPRYVGEILKRLGWSCQRPIVRAKERNEEAIQDWKKKEWLRLKKKQKKSVEP